MCLTLAWNKELAHWWLVELPYWWKWGCCTTILGIFPREVKDIILHEVRLNPRVVRLKQTLEGGKLGKTQNFYLGGGDIWWLYLISLSSSGTIQFGQSVNTLQVPEHKKSLNILGNSEKLKIPIWVEGTFGDYIWSVYLLQVQYSLDNQ